MGEKKKSDTIYPISHETTAKVKEPEWFNTAPVILI